MRRRVLLAALVAPALIMAPISGMAQQAGAVFRIGVLSPAEHPSTRVFNAFRDALLKLGYIEGRNLTIEYAFAAGDNSRLPALAEDLVRLAVDLIVTDGGDEVARIAHRAAPNLPIVMATSADPAC